MIVRTSRRRGRPSGVSDTRVKIIEAARTAFAESGYDGATIRRIAGDADVDPSLVHHYFGSKEALFAEVVRFPVPPSEVLASVLADGPDHAGERIARAFLGLGDNPATRDGLIALVRSALTSPISAKMLREFLSRGPLSKMASTLDGPDVHLRVELAMAQVMGVLVSRYVLRLEPLASASKDEVVAYLAPAIQRYLTPEPRSDPA
jgi:AcrR family transcriptional regulator